MKIEILDSRRLTGPNLFWDRPGAVLDVALHGVCAGEVITTWREEVSGLMAGVGWLPEQTTSRRFKRGVSLVIRAPIDVLYSACELNEVALERTVARLTGAALPSLACAADELGIQVANERKPAMLSLQQTARVKGVPFLWDDDEVSVGFGNGAITWPVDRLPTPRDVDWTAATAIPLGIVTGTNGKSTTVRLAASILNAAGLRAGITSTDYIRVGEDILERGDYSGPGGARTLLRNSRCEAAVLEVARGGLLRRGIGVEHADAALITNIAEDHLGEYGINNVAEMAEAKFIVRRGLGEGCPLILNADDPASVGFATGLDARIIWFGLNERQPQLQAHVRAGRGAAFLRDDWLVLSEGGRARKIVEAKRVPISFAGAARYNISNALAAMALCHVLGATDEALQEGLSKFCGDVDANPGRGNLFEKDGIKIFLDFAHNEHGLKAVADTVRAFQAERNIVLMGQAGDRSNASIGRLVRAACRLQPARLLVCELPGYERGRQPADVPELIAGFALEAGVPENVIENFACPAAGVANALAAARPGDCLVLLATTQRDEVVQLIRKFVTPA